MGSLRVQTWLAVLFLCALPYPMPAVAATQAGDQLDAYFKVFWALCLVLALILILFAMFRKRFSLINPRAEKAIRVLEIQPLAPRKSVCLIEVRGREFLVGVANESITLLADLQEPSPKQSFHDVLTSQHEASR